MTRSPWAPFCAAVSELACLELKRDGTLESLERLAECADALGQLVAVMEDGEGDPLPLSELLRLRGVPDAEAMALDLCQGRVLDVGAGTGVHSIMLVDEGFAVTALDAQQELVAAMQSRGLKDVRCGNVLDDGWAEPGEQWDTLLFMMNGLGLCGNLGGLRQLLVRCHSWLSPGGALLADGCDLRLSPAPEEAKRIILREAAGRAFGETVLNMVFEPRSGERVEGDEVCWLYADYATLESTANAAGWSCQCVYSSGPEYLARLVPAEI